MSGKDLRAFLQKLEALGELSRIKAPVSPILEITEIADRVSKAHGRALLFENVEGSRYPVFINAVGSDWRMALSLGAESLDEIADGLSAYLDFSHYTSIGGVLSFLPKLLRLTCCFPLRVPLGNAACQQVVERSPDLSALPVLQCWPLDGGRFLTLPLVFTKYPDAKVQNIGMYRMQVLSKNTTAIHWQKHKDGSAIYEAWRAHGGRMPVSVALGCGPAVSYAATAPLPPKLDELMLAGFLQKRPVTLTRCVTNGLWVPCDAQFVLEGYVDTEEAPIREGPFGDHTGYYSLADWYPRFHVTCITRQRNPIYPATVVGRPPMEDCYLAKATERIFLPILRISIPQLADLSLPFPGVFHNCAVVSVKNDFPGAARTVMNAIWGMGQMRCTKLIVAVDAGVDPSSYDAVVSAILQNTDFEKDLVISMGPLDALDHSSDQALYGARLGVDAARKPGARIRTGKLHFLPVQKSAAGDGKRAAEAFLRSSPDVKLAVAVDDTVNLCNRQEVLWRVFNNIDAARDLTVENGRAALDATTKLPSEGLTRPWPQDIMMSPDIREQVDRRWEEYGL
ncbi:menaquinone biosynthesis decarboxylase [Anaerotruncus rubiinfantis]|uniref:menaquinone biosynthesis decarboxylase n=1 Tax=Anaerotruncus rubiinfantis TaxID=1720200 RepID=UPI0008324834|nr:menaquinone biosynthesis decarboxylase [Anaerotruncus rubiinfantis]